MKIEYECKKYKSDEVEVIETSKKINKIIFQKKCNYYLTQMYKNVLVKKHKKNKEELSLDFTPLENQEKLYKKILDIAFGENEQLIKDFVNR